MQNEFTHHIYDQYEKMWSVDASIYQIACFFRFGFKFAPVFFNSLILHSNYFVAGFWVEYWPFFSQNNAKV